VERGITVALTTSRRYVGTAPVAEALGIAGPLILYDGALVRHYPSADIFLHRPLASDVVRRTVDIMAHNGLRPIVQGSGANGESLLVPDSPAHSMYDGDFLRGYAHQVQMVELERLHTLATEPLRVVAFGPKDVLEPIKSLLMRLPVGVQLLPLGSYGTAELTVFSPSASKGAALAAVASARNIPMREVFAIGDSVNDVSMLRVAGMAVAMENGHPAAQAAAHALAPSNDADGLAEAVERFVLDEDVKVPARRHGDANDESRHAGGTTLAE
jgi:hydroxymethylpyrimidine pyrophosphatase-like HAD family hydrolase